MRKIEAVIFDAYGTLVRIRSPRGPFRRLMAIGEQTVRGWNGELAKQLIMGTSVSLEQAAKRLAIDLAPDQLQDLNLQLQEEIQSVEPYPEVESVLRAIRRMGGQIAICSNLAQPYIAPVMSKLGPLVDHATWSCMEGFLKPAPEIFHAAVNRLRVPSNAALMIGDSYKADVVGARAAGIRALFLDRFAESGDLRTLEHVPRIYGGDS